MTAANLPLPRPMRLDFCECVAILNGLDVAAWAGVTGGKQWTGRRRAGSVYRASAACCKSPLERGKAEK
ncbi:hypothetical protein LMG29739_05244 [Paraburkholderia solisilvae]|uniref:Uncharacterized protein n=1 Tax=Paraburkholderia solisilvae TaxID=624376 RepID=A0A6J5ENU6_9BURK|nr:hypothetical protein LMG29739_05244 [Paraburkholderia solisilvae]